MAERQLLDRWGNPVRRAELSRVEETPRFGNIRSPLTGYPADGLNPLTLAAMLRAADAGDPLRYLELAEQIEERDAHYLGVLGTRRRSVSQIEVTVKAASDAAQDIKIADMVRDWLDRDELSGELFHILDCLGKGFSFTRIDWEVSEGQWRPARLVREDPRYFRFARHDLQTPLQLSETGSEQPLEPYRYIYATIQAKSGLALRSGLARVAAWGWMFKAYTQRDWAIFTQTYGQPLRIGKWSAGASEEDKANLFRAVANIAQDCAAIIPSSMQIEFIESKSIGASSDLYERRADWIDRQISKAVLGQTATTDAVTGGLGSGKEHRQVQEDIETADARDLAAILNRDLIRPWVNLEFGPQKRYPRLVIARPEEEDLKQMADALNVLVPLGLRVEESAVRDRLGFADPPKGARILAPVRAPEPPMSEANDPNSKIKRESGVFKRGEQVSGVVTALNSSTAPVGDLARPSEVDLLTDRMTQEAAPAMERLLEQVEAMVGSATSLEELREMMLVAFPTLDTGDLARVIAKGLLSAHLGGRVMAGEESDG